MRPTSWAGALSTSRAGSLLPLTPAFVRFENVLPIVLVYVDGIIGTALNGEAAKLLTMRATVREAIQQRFSSAYKQTRVEFSL